MFTILALASALILLVITLTATVNAIRRGRSGFDETSLEDQLGRLDELSRQRALIKRELYEIKLDLDTGKISDEDFALLDGRYKRRFLKIDKELEALSGSGQHFRDEILADVAARVQARRQAHLRTPRQRTLCPECGEVNATQAVRCRACGAALRPSTSPPVPAPS